jgi:hypothetical protein
VSRLWTPGNPDAEGQSEILVPRGYEQAPKYRCRVCGAAFWDGQESKYESHVGACARAELEALKADSPKARMPWSDEENWDPEAAEHLRKVGERMLAEGRLETKPSERIGD